MYVIETFSVFLARLPPFFLLFHLMLALALLLLLLLSLLFRRAITFDIYHWTWTIFIKKNNTHADKKGPIRKLFDSFTHSGLIASLLIFVSLPIDCECWNVCMYFGSGNRFNVTLYNDSCEVACTLELGMWQIQKWSQVSQMAYGE